MTYGTAVAFDAATLGAQATGVSNITSAETPSSGNFMDVRDPARNYA